jgi:hypothetical protein
VSRYKYRGTKRTVAADKTFEDKYKMAFDSDMRSAPSAFGVGIKYLSKLTADKNAWERPWKHVSTLKLEHE